MAGTRPSAHDVERLLSASEPPGEGAGVSNARVSQARVSQARVSQARVSQTRVSHRPDPAEGWLELLASGLTFDLAGLAPASGGEVPACRYRFGLAADQNRDGFEAVSLRPGPHIASGGAMMPVVRVMAGLAARLAGLPGVQAVCWHPAASWMDPGYFAKVVGNWLDGGAFPALGLIALHQAEGGLMQSDGLAFFIGQELAIEPRNGEAPAQTIKLGVRIIDTLVRSGALKVPEELESADHEVLIAVPSHDGRRVLVRRGG